MGMSVVQWGASTLEVIPPKDAVGTADGDAVLKIQIALLNWMPLAAAKATA
jgi:hypothetical protein